MQLTYNQTIRESLDRLMNENSKVILFGLGITDPKRFFGTTDQLLEKYSKDRVIECPTSENAYLGHALGLSLEGYIPIVHFQRMDFMLYAFDQLINNIAKWRDMFNLKLPMPIVVRALVGIGWGQGAQHSQNLSAILAQIPGLIVVAPTCPTSAAQLLRLSVQGSNPVIIVEHRWLQYLSQEVAEIDLKTNSDDWKIGQALIRKSGSLLTIVSWSYGIVEAMRIANLFPDQDFEIIDLLTLSPLDITTIIKSGEKTKNIFILEPAWSYGGLASEIMAQLYGRIIGCKIIRLGYTFKNPSSARSKLNEVYPDLHKIINTMNTEFHLSLKLPDSAYENWPIDQDNTTNNPWFFS